MSLRAWLWLFAGILVLGLGGVAALFWVQNSATPAPVSLEIWFLGRWGKAWTVSQLVALSAGLGFLFAAFPWFFSAWRAGSRIKELERRLSFAQPEDGSRAWK